MNTKLTKSFAAACVLVLMFAAVHTASAQQRTRTVTRTHPSVTDVMQSNALPAGASRLDNGNVLLSDGSVQATVTDQSGMTSVVTYTKPVIAADAKDAYTPSDEWMTEFKNWMSENPESAKFLTAEELAYAQAGDVAGVYKSMYHTHQMQAVREQSNRK